MMRKYIYFVEIVLVLICFFLFSLGTYDYQGSKLYYIVFSVIYFMLLLSAIKQVNSYSYLFLGIFLWLGFWLKFTVHTVLSYQYREAVGQFVQTPQALDELLLVSTVGCLGVFIAKWLSGFTGKINFNWDNIFSKNKVPLFYQKTRTIVLPLFIVVAVLCGVFNLYYGIDQIGLSPKTILMWPLNALISWLVTIGLSLMLSTLLFWEVSYKQNWSFALIYMCIEGFISSVSIMSRLLYIGHVFPLGLAGIVHRRKLPPIGLLKQYFFFLFAGVFFLMSIVGTTALRNHFYSGERLDLSFHQVSIIKDILVDRWIGVEGVMAVSSYEQKNIALFRQGLSEKRAFGRVGMYQLIADSQYKDTDLDKYMFGTLPGPIAFMYYSGSYWVVFFGLLCLTLMMLYSEKWVVFLVKNPFLWALYGMSI